MKPEGGDQMTTNDIHRYAERLTTVEALLKSILLGQEKMERQITSRFDKFEDRYDRKLETLITELVSHKLEDGENFKRLKYRVVEYIVISVVGMMLGIILIQLAL